MYFFCFSLQGLDLANPILLRGRRKHVLKKNMVVGYGGKTKHTGPQFWFIFPKNQRQKMFMFVSFGQKNFKNHIVKGNVSKFCCPLLVC